MNTSSPAASSFPVIDGHADLVYALTRPGTRRRRSQEVAALFGRAALDAGGVRVLVSALYCADRWNGPGRALGHLRRLQALAEGRLSGLPRITTGRQLADCFKGAGPCASLPLLENGDGLLEGNLEELEGWGLRTVGLTHAGRNRLADGNGVANPTGLTAAGRSLLDELEKRRWVIDTAHLAQPGFWQLMESYSGPLICSHTGLRPFCDTPRNLDRRQIQALRKRGGIIGLSFAPEMLSANGVASLEDACCQIDWLVQAFGPEGIALGTDFGGFSGSCTGLANYGQLRRLAAWLRDRGYPDAVVGDLFGGNWYRFFRERFREWDSQAGQSLEKKGT